MTQNLLASLGLVGGIGAAQALLIAVVALAASIITAIAGVGGAIVLSFVLTPVLGPAALVQTISVAMIINNLTKINVFRKGIDWAQCLFVVGCAAPGCAIGSLIYSSLSERAITIVLGVFLIGTLLNFTTFSLTTFIASFDLGPLNQVTYWVDVAVVAFLGALIIRGVLRPITG